MILKSLSRKQESFNQLFTYMLHDKGHLTAKGSFVLQHNVNGKGIDAWTKAFMKNERNRVHHRSNSVKVYHEVMSFNKRDAPYITASMLLDFASKYTQLRADNALCIAIPHFDKDNPHVHFAISGVDGYTGLSSRVSQERFKEIKLEMQSYQLEKYPELYNSIVDHNKKERTKNNEREFQLLKRSKEASEKGKIKLMLKEIYNTSNSKDDFYSKIEQQGYKIYERGNKKYGVIIDTRKIRFNTLGFNERQLDGLNILNEFQKLRERTISERELRR